MNTNLTISSLISDWRFWVFLLVFLLLIVIEQLFYGWLGRDNGSSNKGRSTKGRSKNAISEYIKLSFFVLCLIYLFISLVFSPK